LVGTGLFVCSTHGSVVAGKLRDIKMKAYFEAVQSDCGNDNALLNEEN
jgi:hypothetical protein